MTNKYHCGIKPWIYLLRHSMSWSRINGWTFKGFLWLLDIEFGSSDLHGKCFDPFCHLFSPSGSIIIDWVVIFIYLFSVICEGCDGHQHGVGVRVHICHLHLHTRPKDNLWCSPTMVFEREHFNGIWALEFSEAMWPANPRNWPLSASLVLGLQMCTTNPGVLYGCRWSN